MNMIEINLKSGNVCTYCMFYITFLQCEQLTDFKPLLMQSSPEFMGKKLNSASLLWVPMYPYCNKPDFYVIIYCMNIHAI